MADTPSYAVDSFKVEAYIRQAVAKNNRGLDRMEETLRAARVYLRDERRKKENWHDINLAAAEHYMLMRWLVCATGDPSVVDAPMIYKWKKQGYALFGAEKRMQTSQGPALPPNSKVEEFGARGAREGWADFLVKNPGAGANTGAGWKWLASEAYRL
jgi:hypothetical protein